MAKKPIDLDAYGAMAGPDDLDPEHMRALGTRISTLANEIEKIRGEGHIRDQKLDQITVKVDGVSAKLETVDEEVNDLLRKQITSDDMKTLRALIIGHDTRGRVGRWVRRWAAYVAGTATAMWVLHEPIAAILRYLGRISG
jgi:hypothetical protein